MEIPEELNKSQIEKILQGIAIPPQPQIMVDLHIQQTIRSNEIEPITELIRTDVGLSGSILKTVNSPFFGLKNKISSIEQAIQLLGLKSVINIVNALSIGGKLTDETIVSLTHFWDTATDIALVSATIAKDIGFESPDEAYSLGLFHNCGIPLLMERFENYPSIIAKAYAAATKRVTEVENEILSTNHSVVGYYVGKSWGLPGYLCETISIHHNVDKIFTNNAGIDRKHKTLLAILKMAEHICSVYALIGKQQEDHEWERISDGLTRYLGLSFGDVDTMVENFQEMGIGGADITH